MARGLSADDALAAVTTIPARQLGLADRLGTIEPGKIANLVVETGQPFAENSRVTEIWIDGSRTELRDGVQGEIEVRGGRLVLAGRSRARRAAGARARGRPRRRAVGGPRPQRDRLDAGNGRDSRERRRARRQRQDHGGRQEPRGAGGRPRGRRPRQARHARHHRRPLPLGRRRRRQRGHAQRHGRGAHPRRPQSAGRRHLPRARRRHDDRERPPRLGQRDRRPDPDRQAALGRRTRRARLRRRARGHQVRARREPEAVQLVRTRIRRYPRTRMGVAESDPRAVPGGPATTGSGRTNTARRRR